MLPGATLAEMQAAGAQRVSIGGSLPFVGAKPIIESCEAMLNEGSFNWVSEMASPGSVMALINTDSS